MDTSGYGGKKLSKKATVYTNDKDRPALRLTVSGNVERFADINPQRVLLSGYGSDPIRRVVKIIPRNEYPFKIVNAKAKNGRNIHFELVESENPVQAGYELHIENRKTGKGSYHDTIQLTTDSKIKPLLLVRIRGNIKTKVPDQSDKTDGPSKPLKAE